jgi:hypothetical protein
MLSMLSPAASVPGHCPAPAAEVPLDVLELDEPCPELDTELWLTPDPELAAAPELPFEEVEPQLVAPSSKA